MMIPVSVCPIVSSRLTLSIRMLHYHHHMNIPPSTHKQEAVVTIKRTNIIPIYSNPSSSSASDHVADIDAAHHSAAATATETPAQII